MNSHIYLSCLQSTTIPDFSSFRQPLCPPFLIPISCFPLQKFEYPLWNTGIRSTFNEHYTHKFMHNTKTLHKILPTTSPVPYSTIPRINSTSALPLVTGYPMAMLLRFLVDLSKYQFPLDSRPWTCFSISLQLPSMCLPYVHLWKSHLNATPESPSCLASTLSVLFFMEPHRVRQQNGFILDETSLKVAASHHWRGWLWI